MSKHLATVVRKRWHRPRSRPCLLVGAHLSLPVELRERDMKEFRIERLTRIHIPVSSLFFSVFFSPSTAMFVVAGKWHLGVNCEQRGDHCHHPNQHGFSYFYGLPFTLFNDCVPGEERDILTDLQQTLRNLTLMLGLGLFTLVWLIIYSFNNRKIDLRIYIRIYIEYKRELPDRKSEV